MVSSIQVRFAEEGDQARLIEFIRDHWSPTHIFTQRPTVFSWQYLQADGRLNMVVAERVDGSEQHVLGVLGFIPLGRFAPELGDRDVLLAIWKVDESAAPPGLGLRLLKFLQSSLEPRLIAAIGTSQMVRRIYEVLRYTVGEMHQSAVFHPQRRGLLRIADHVPAEAFDEVAEAPTQDLELVRFEADDAAELRETVDAMCAESNPSKSWAYVEHRYLRHPWYRYDARLVRADGRPEAVVVWRKVHAAGAHVLRVVDVIGDTTWLLRSRSALQAAVVAADAEYLDVMQWGIAPELFRDAGFVSPDDHPDMVLPNYFSPFERRNVRIELAARVFDDGPPPVLFRADSDQDRPNATAEVDAVT